PKQYDFGGLATSHGGPAGRTEMPRGSVSSDGGSAYYVGIFVPTHVRKPKAPTTVGTSADPAFNTAFDPMLVSALANGARFVALGVVKAGKLYYANAYTLAEDTYQPVNVTSNFRLASVAKSITSIAIMKLYENGTKAKSPALQLTESVPAALGNLFTPL